MAHSALYGIWQKGTGEQRWHFGMSVDDLVKKDKKYFDRGLRMTDLTVRDDHYTAVWRPGTGEQRAQMGMSQDEFKTTDKKWFKHGLRLHCLSVDDNSYTAVWRPGEGEQRWVANTSIDAFKLMDTGWFLQGLRIRYISVDGESVTCVWRPGQGEQRVLLNASIENLMALDIKYFKKGLVMKKLSVDDSGLSNLSGGWTAVWRPGTGPMHWISALPANFKTLDAEAFKAGQRLITAGVWDAGGLDFSFDDVGKFFKDLWDAIWNIHQDDNSSDPEG